MGTQGDQDHAQDQVPVEAEEEEEELISSGELPAFTHKLHPVTTSLTGGNGPMKT